MLSDDAGFVSARDGRDLHDGQGDRLSAAIMLISASLLCSEPRRLPMRDWIAFHRGSHFPEFHVASAALP